ncbi:hypothetical protein [Sutcliffiella cohnii]|uniref:hypothetical protein n=1 Tax=Sutcliffiella cohnii TaxID=33932 RepID=UPI002E230740|nr:hypothetical protein [Sutcliffiella cohnii]
MEKYSFFDSIVDDVRFYNADDYANYFRQFLSTGVYKHEDSTNLSVTASGNGMTTTLNIGSAFIEGYLYQNTESLELTHDAAEATTDRIDTIVLRLDKSADNRYIRAFVKKGTPSINPVAPNLTETSLVKEIRIVDVLIVAGKSFIEQSQVTDKRKYVDVLETMYPKIERVQALESNAITEVGNNANGRYIRYENGLQICYAFIGVTGLSTSTFGNIYRILMASRNYPANFISLPAVSIDITNSSSFWGTAQVLGETGTTTYSPVALSANPQTDVTVGFSIIAIGRWK